MTIPLNPSNHSADSSETRSNDNLDQREQSSLASDATEATSKQCSSESTNHVDASVKGIDSIPEQKPLRLIIDTKMPWAREVPHPVKANKTISLITAFGEEKSIMEWSRDVRCLVTEQRLRSRLLNRHWQPEQALSLPMDYEKTASRNLATPSAINSLKFEQFKILRSLLGMLIPGYSNGRMYSDSDIHRLLNSRPQTLAEIASVQGWGASKAKAFGRYIVRILRGELICDFFEEEWREWLYEQFWDLTCAFQRKCQASKDTGLNVLISEYVALVARDLNVETYFVLRRDAISNIAQARPTTVGELAELHGVGIETIKNHAASILALVSGADPVTIGENYLRSSIEQRLLTIKDDIDLAWRRSR